jgi:hypothetical protein
MPHADMTESIENAFMREDAVGERQFLDRSRYSIEHSFPQFLPRMAVILRGQIRSGRQIAHVEGADRSMQTFEVELAERFEFGELFNRDLDPTIDQNLSVIGVRA